jgi:lipoprotein NlpI
MPSPTTKAIELDPGDGDAYVNRGVHYHELGEHVTALEDYDKAIELDSDDAYAYYNRGVTLEILVKPALASKDFDKACELDRSLCELVFE